MKRLLILALPLTILALLPLFSGCNKEKIVNSTEYVEKYIAGPTDTVYRTDTVRIHDSTAVHVTDTITITDTVHTQTTVHDTVTVTQTLHDTVIVTQNHYDTVQVTSYQPSGQTAFTALQAYNDPMVIDFINGEFGYTDGWIFYLSTYQVDLTEASSGVYDIYGYIDYWAPDWSGYYPLEFYWRMTYTGGDPSDPNNWTLGEPTSKVGHQPGIKLSADGRKDIQAER